MVLIQSVADGIGGELLMNDAFEFLMEAVPWVHVCTLLESTGRMAESVSRTELDGEPIAIGNWGVQK
ncbi:hypothetical protein D7Y44_09965 [Stenotrophomonas maltophilia]|nr:hypothetical protein [Stenotrophomonas maltophilia]MBA0344659.1 hypothetical protein [Stenotrophomonas maltophilia]MBA0357761.1 hypothetical protein [Stenotrophomonas maltophilia]MBA0519791.1 hypothetical protein [Stenotrophomonas maltophilia]